MSAKYEPDDEVAGQLARELLAWHEAAPALEEVLYMAGCHNDECNGDNDTEYERAKGYIDRIATLLEGGTE